MRSGFLVCGRHCLLVLALLRVDLKCDVMDWMSCIVSHGQWV